MHKTEGADLDITAKICTVSLSKIVDQNNGSLQI